MASSLTNTGQQIMLLGNGAGDGSLARIAAAVKLYTSASTPNVNGSGFTEVANGNGYGTGGHAITVSNWTASTVSGNVRITLANQVWTATGAVSNIAGAYLTDGSGNVLAWWERGSTLTLASGDTLTLSSPFVGLQ